VALLLVVAKRIQRGYRYVWVVVRKWKSSYRQLRHKRDLPKLSHATGQSGGGQHLVNWGPLRVLVRQGCRVAVSPCGAVRWGEISWAWPPQRRCEAKAGAARRCTANTSRSPWTTANVHLPPHTATRTLTRRTFLCSPQLGLKSALRFPCMIRSLWAHLFGYRLATSLSIQPKNPSSTLALFFPSHLFPPPCSSGETRTGQGRRSHLSARVWRCATVFPALQCTWCQRLNVLNIQKTKASSK
jgi:hypothetical protein